MLVTTIYEDFNQGDLISLREKVSKGKFGSYLPAFILSIFIIFALLLLTTPWRHVGIPGEAVWQVSMALNYDHYSFLTPFSIGASYDLALPAGDFANLPPLYSWIIRLAMVSTGHIEAGKFVSLMFGIGTLLLTFKICKVLYGRKTGYVAMLLLATSLLFIVDSTVTMPETMMLFFSAFSVLLLIKFIETDNNKYLLAAGATAFLSAFAKWPGIFTLVTVGGYSLYKKGPKILRNRAFYASLLIPVFLCLIWFFHIKSIASGSPTTVGLLDYLFFNLSEVPLSEALTNVGYELTVYIPLTTLGLALIGIFLKKKETHLPLFWLMGGALYYLLFLRGAVVHFHYSSLMLPPLAILGARGAIALSNKVESMVKTKKHLILPSLSITLVLIATVGIGYACHYYHQRYGLYVKDMSLAGELIQKNAGENGLIALSGDAFYVYFHTSIDIARIRLIGPPYDESIKNIGENPKIIVVLMRNPEGVPSMGTELSENFENELIKILALDNYQLSKGYSYFRVIMKTESPP